MKKLLILVDKKSEKKTKLFNYLSDYLKEDAEVLLKEFPQLIYEMSEEGVSIKIDSIDLKDVNLVYFRRVGDYLPFAGAVCRYLESNNIEFIDESLKKGGLFEDKLTSLVNLSLEKLPVIHSVFIHKEQSLKNMDLIIQKIGFPLIVKGIYSHRMEEVYLIKSKDELEKLLTDNPEQEFLFQKYVDNSEEYRLLVLGEKVAVAQRKVERFIKDNKITIDEEAKELFVDINSIPEEMKKIAVDSARILEDQIVGADIVWDKKANKFWIIEINRCPGILANEELSPELKAFGQFFKEELSRND
jgi:glutathione synthase/RimK-type ligase-like ATP-grasp enzyme